MAPDYTIIRRETFGAGAFVEQLDKLHSRLQPTLWQLSSQLPDNTSFLVITYHYTSLDEMSKPIVLSALMVVPYKGGQFSAPRMMLENRATQAADHAVPTNQWNIGTVHAITNSVLVTADLISFGASVDRPICYCHAGLAVRHTVDAVVAAQHILMHDLQLVSHPLPIYNGGHSLGGYNALAVHRYWETEATDEEKEWLPLVETYCASGPYVLDEQMQIIAEKGKYLYGAYMIMNAMSHIVYHRDCFDENVTIDDFLTPEAKAAGVADWIADRRLGNADLIKTIVEHFGTKMSALFVADAYLPDGNLYRMMLEASQQDRLLDGWTPTRPIHFYHARYDECVPIENMQAAERAFHGNPLVTFDTDEWREEPLVHKYSGGAHHRHMLMVLDSKNKD